GHLLALAALFLLLNAQFVAAAQVVVYAGAVMVLYVFVVAYVGGNDEPVELMGSGSGLRAVAILACGALFVELCVAVLGSGLQAINSRGAHIVASFGTPAEIGKALLTKFLFPFEAASLLLLVAAIGAVILARRRRGMEPDTPTTGAIAVRRPAYSGTMFEAVGGAMEREHVPASGATGHEPAPESAVPDGERSGGGW
ncbi:MAG TPA: NADH-quinone oxidoreductase subunit J, partial [Solirubrobacteraceae bacterium]